MSNNQFDPSQYGEADRREVDPPIQVESATWAPGGQLDWWVKEYRPRVEWLGRVRGADGRQRWVRAVDLRPKDGGEDSLGGKAFCANSNISLKRSEGE
jgi:hypothetical protein